MTTTNAVVMSPSDFFSNVEAQSQGKTQGLGKGEEIVSNVTTPESTEQPAAPEVPTDEVKVDEVEPVNTESTPKAEETPTDEEELPENATKGQRQAFANMRKQIQDLKKEIASKTGPEIGEEDKVDIEFYRKNKNRIDSSFKVVEALATWQRDPNTALKDIKNNFPQVYDQLVAEMKTSQPEKPTAPATPDAVISQETVLTDLGINIEEVEEESTTIAANLKKMATAMAQAQNQLMSKQKALEDDFKATKEELSKKQELEEQKVKETETHKIRTLEKTWYNSIEGSLKEYGLDESAVDLVYTNIMTKLNADISAGKYQGITIDDMGSKVDINSYLDNVLKVFNVKKAEPVKVTATPQAPVGLKTNLSKTQTATKPSIPKSDGVLGSKQFFDYIENK